jgi:hypothetical protein
MRAHELHVADAVRVLLCDPVRAPGRGPFIAVLNGTKSTNPLVRTALLVCFISRLQYTEKLKLSSAQKQSLSSCVLECVRLKEPPLPV